MEKQAVMSPQHLEHRHTNPWSPADIVFIGMIDKSGDIRWHDAAGFPAGSCWYCRELLPKTVDDQKGQTG